MDNVQRSDGKRVCVCALGLAHNVHRIVFIMYIYISILFDENW